MFNRIIAIAFTFSILVAGATAPTLKELGIDDRDLQAINELANGQVPHGKFRGKTLNTAVRRPLYVIGTGSGYSESLVQKLNAETVLVGNFYHEGEFYVARIPIAAVSSVVLLVAPFSSIASHTMLRFVTDRNSPIELVAKINSDPEKRETQIQTLEKPIALKDLVFSIDGAEPRGIGPWNMNDAISGSYTLAYRMVSIQERFGWFVMEGTPIHQIELNIKRDLAQRVLRNGIEKSQTIGWSTLYRLICANCTNLAIRLFKNSVSYRERGSKPGYTVKRYVQEKLDPALRFLEPFTQFSRLNLNTLGWLGRDLPDLQQDPMFRDEMMAVVVEYREMVKKMSDLSATAKAKLISDLGIDSDLGIIDDPSRYRKALGAFRASIPRLKAAELAKASCVRHFSRYN